MDRGAVLAHLEIAERYVDTGGRYIGRLRDTVDARARGGSDTKATHVQRDDLTVDHCLSGLAHPR